MTMKRRKTIKKPSFLKQYLGSLIIVAAILITIGVIVCAGAANSYSKDVSLYRTNAGNMVEYAGNESLFNEKIARSDVTYLIQLLLDK